MTNNTKKAYLIYSGDEMPYEPTHVIATFLDKENIPHVYLESKGGHDMTFWSEYVVRFTDMMFGKNEVIIQDTKNHEIDCMASISITPENIHIMKKLFTSNIYEAYIDKQNRVVIDDGAFECDVTQLLPGSHLDEEGYLVDAAGTKYDLTDADVKAEIGLHDIEIIDNEEDGIVAGEIVSIIYKGDHYQVIIRTANDEDFVVDTEYTWNEFDRVSVKVDPAKIKLTLKDEVKKYAKE